MLANEEVFLVLNDSGYLLFQTVSLQAMIFYYTTRNKGLIL